MGAWDGAEAVARSCALPPQHFHCYQQRQERTICCRCPSPGVLTVPTMHSPALWSCCTALLAAEIHVAHVLTASFHSWYHSAMAFRSSHVSSSTTPVPPAPGSRERQKSWGSFCEESFSSCYAER